MREEKFKTLEVCTILWICTRCKAALNILLGNFQNLQAVEIHPNASQYHKQCLSSWSLLILFLHKAGKNHESLKVNSPGAASSQNRIFSNPQNLSIFQIYWFDLSKNFQNFLIVRGSSRSSSSGARYMILQSKIGWRKVKMCRFGSGKPNSCNFPCLVNDATQWCTSKKECNKLDLTAAQYFWLVDHNEWSRWFAISSPHVFVVPVRVLLVGLPKKTQLNLDI